MSALRLVWNFVICLLAFGIAVAMVCLPFAMGGPIVGVLFLIFYVVSGADALPLLPLEMIVERNEAALPSNNGGTFKLTVPQPTVLHAGELRLVMEPFMGFNKGQTIEISEVREYLCVIKGRLYVNSFVEKFTRGQ